MNIGKSLKRPLKNITKVALHPIKLVRDEVVRPAIKEVKKGLPAFKVDIPGFDKIKACPPPYVWDKETKQCKSALDNDKENKKDQENNKECKFGWDKDSKRCKSGFSGLGDSNKIKSTLVLAILAGLIIWWLSKNQD